MLTLIFIIKAQVSNQLIELNNKPFPVFLFSTKNETHYYILTSGESVSIEIQTGNIERIPKESSTYHRYCIFFTDSSNDDYMYYDYTRGFLKIDCCPPTITYTGKKISISTSFVPTTVGSMTISNNVIIYAYTTNYIYFFYMTGSINPSVNYSIKRLISCKILKYNSRFICIGNIELKDNIALYIISYTSRLYVENYNTTLFNGYYDGYLYDTSDLNNKILCAQLKDKIKVNCWLCNISSTSSTYEITELSEVFFETYKYYEEDCYLDLINSIYLFCCGRINGLTCFAMDSNFNFIGKNELNIYGNSSYVTIINLENIPNILFMNTIIINENKNNYTSYLYKLINFSFTKEDITDITSDNYQNIPTSYYSTYYVNSKTDNSYNFDNSETIKQTEIEEIIDNNIDYLKKYYYKTDVNKGIDFELKENNILYTLTSILNQKNNLNKNKTTVDLEQCGNILKNQVYNEIPENANLYIIKIDINEEGMKIPKIEYGLYYPLYNQDLIELNMSKCKDQNVDITIPISIKDDIDKYNTSSDYYNNKCSKATSKNGTDITLHDRKNEFIDNNMTLCEEDCSLVEYNKTTEKVKCNCKIKINLPIIQKVKFDKNQLLEHFTDINRIMNIELLKCYKKVFIIKNLIKNYGFLFYSFMLLLYVICLLIFYLKSFSILTKEAKKIVNDIESVSKQKKIKKVDLNKSIDDDKSVKSRAISVNTILNKGHSKSKRKKDKNKNKNIKNINLLDRVKTMPKRKKDKNNNKNIKSINLVDSVNTTLNKGHSMPKRKKDKNNNKNKIIKSINLLDSENKLLNINKIKKNKNMSRNKYKSPNNTSKNNKKVTFNFEILKTNNDLNEQNNINYNDTELNLLKYEQALLYDKRTFCQYYFSLLKKGQLLIFSFYFNSNDYNSQIIKIFLFFFFLSVHLFVNALFFNDDTIHRIYEDEGDFNLIYQIPQIIYSSLISVLISTLIKFLSLTEKDILNLKSIKEIKILNSEYNKLIKIYKIKFALFFIITLFMLIIFLYYVSSFCGVFINSQIHLFDDSLISFGTSFIYPFGIYIMPGIFRMIALHGKDKSCLYRFSQFIQNL